VPIVKADVPWRYSIRTGTAGNSTAQGSPHQSLGKYISTTVWGGALHDLFPRLEGEENAGQVAKYRCAFVANLHASLTWLDTRVFMPSGDPAGGALVAIALDPTPASPLGSVAAQALSITDDLTAPAGLTWLAPTTYAAGLQLGDLLPGYCRAVWIRRTGANGAQLAAPEQVTFRARGGTLG